MQNLKDFVSIDYENNILFFNNIDDKKYINLFTLRPYNFNKKTLSEKEIEDNWDKIKKYISYDLKLIKKPIQTHTNNIAILSSDNLDDKFEDIDGLITNLKDIGLAISVADCQAIVFIDEKKEVIANIHSGWKGTLSKISKNAIDIFINQFNSDIEDIKVYIYPSILKESFEVDEDVKDMFLENFKEIDINVCIEKGEIKDNKQKYLIDTINVNKLLLKKLGIKEKNIFLSNIDTLTNSDLIHSHRGEGVKSGRNIALIAMKSKHK